MLQGSIKKTPGNYILLVIGDLNAKVGTDIERGGSKQSALKGLKKEI